MKLLIGKGFGSQGESRKNARYGVTTVRKFRKILVQRGLSQGELEDDRFRLRSAVAFASRILSTISAFWRASHTSVSLPKMRFLDLSTLRKISELSGSAGRIVGRHPQIFARTAEAQKYLVSLFLWSVLWSSLLCQPSGRGGAHADCVWKSSGYGESPGAATRGWRVW